jgi:hypothetical protein
VNAFTLDPQSGVLHIKDMPETEVLRIVDEQYQIFKEMEKLFLSKCHESWMADDANVYSCDMLMTDVCNYMMKLRHHFDVFLCQDDFIMSASMIRMMIDPMLNFYARRFVSCYDLYTNLLNGEELSDLKHGNQKLSYSFLSRELESEYNGYYHKFYKLNCSAIHFSSWHCFLNKTVKKEEAVISLAITKNTDKMKSFQKAELLIQANMIFDCMIWLLDQWIAVKGKETIAPVASMKQPAK